jgi:hypothetical protein
MAETAASGGYWISMDATRIVAAPGTLTGSIGVFAGKPVLSELSQEIGVNWGRVQRGANADMWSVLEAFDARGRARLDAFLDQVYEAFTEGVARGRGLPAPKVMEIAQGRVWTGAQAKEVGLVDELGGFARALEVAKEIADIGADEPVELRRFPEPTPPWQQALDLLGRGSPLGLESLARRLGLLWPGALSRRSPSAERLEDPSCSTPPGGSTSTPSGSFPSLSRAGSTSTPSRRPGRLNLHPAGRLDPLPSRLHLRPLSKGSTSAPGLYLHSSRRRARNPPLPAARPHPLRRLDFHPLPTGSIPPLLAGSTSAFSSENPCCRKIRGHSFLVNRGLTSSRMVEKATAKPPARRRIPTMTWVRLIMS